MPKRQSRRAIQATARRREIQATEAQKAIDTYCLTDGIASGTIGGAVNNYKTYASQVTATINKYAGNTDWGAQLTRSIIDIRTAFLVSEGLNVSAMGDDSLNTWLDMFLTGNLLNGSRLVALAKGCEIRGRELYRLKPTNVQAGAMPRIERVFQDYVCHGSPGEFNLNTLAIDNGENKIPANPRYYVLFVTGGDGLTVSNPTTRTGILLNDIENYDRAKKDLRINNHILARITPVFETGSDQETSSLLGLMAKLKWQIGKPFVGSAKFRYETVGTGAAENIRQEIDTSIMSICGTSGIPPHWLGHTDLLSNRSTAQDLYQSLLNATAAERLAVEESLYNMILKAQEMYIESGGTIIKTVSSKFTVKLPAVDYTDFKNLVQGLSLALTDGMISMTDARNKIPGIDPLNTAKEVDGVQE